MGDFNIDQLKTSTFKRSIETLGLEQTIKGPTRITKDSSTLIDHIYVSVPELYSSSGVVPIGLSDHHLVYLFRKKNKQGVRNEHVYMKYRDQKRFDENEFLNDLRGVKWSKIKSYNNVNSMWSEFKSLFMKIVDKHMPVRERRIRTDSEKWINHEVLSEMRQRDFLHRESLRSRQTSDWARYRAARNRVVKVIGDANREFVDNAINQCSDKPKNMWSILKQFLPSASLGTSTSYLEIDDELVSDSYHISNAFDDFFCSIGKNLQQILMTYSHKLNS
jgi:hypothetical protein